MNTQTFHRPAPGQQRRINSALLCADLINRPPEQRAALLQRILKLAKEGRIKL